MDTVLIQTPWPEQIIQLASSSFNNEIARQQLVTEENIILVAGNVTQHVSFENSPPPYEPQ